VSGANAPPVQGLTRKAVHGTGWSALATIAKQLLSFASVAILARLLGPSVYGLMGMATLVIVFLTNFRDLGTATAIIQRPHVSKRLLSSLFWVNCGLGIALFAIAFVGAVPAAHFFRDPRVTPILRTISLSFCVTTLGTVPNALLARRMDFRSIAITDATSTLVGYGVSIPCAFAGLGVWSLVIGSLVNVAVATGLYFFFSAWHPSLEFDSHEVRSVARFSLNLAGFGMVNYFSRNADNIIVGRWLGVRDLGFYQMAYNLFLFPLQNITSVIGQVLNPAFSKIQDDNERFRSAYLRSCMIIALIAFPVIAGLGVVARPFVAAILGTRWLPVVPLLEILAPIGLFQSVQATVGQIYVAKGRTDWMFWIGTYVAVVSVIGFLIGVRWGTLGVATSYFIVYFLLVLYPSLHVPFRLIDLSVAEFVRRLWPQFCITFGMAGVCLAWLAGLRAAGVANPTIQLLSTVAIGAVVYVGTVLLVRPLALLHFEASVETSQLPMARQILLATRAFMR
jgi:O-antigen/teichoic acid export membrane protein